ncbi:hypothetical protein HRbin33_00101 [bacterium HR33]|nr:hypothetical protein HRbin33_00101 [bacterium HR33]
MSTAIKLSLATLFGCLYSNALQAQSPGGLLGKLDWYADFRLGLATAISRDADGGGDYPGAGMQRLQLGLRTGAIAFYAEFGRWVAARGRTTCPGWAGPCARIVPLRSLDGGLSFAPWPRAGVSPYLAASLGVLTWDRNDERFHNPAYAVRFGVHFRVSERVAFGLELSRRKLVAGPLYLGDRIGYYGVAAGARYLAPLTRRD